jgi:short-subunit dehydrogenase
MFRQHRVIAITGASAGVGRATALAFARERAWIGLIAREKQRLRSTKAEVEAAGGRALVLPADVADYPQVERAAAQIEAEFGPIDVWVNNAMTTVFAPFDEITPEEFKRATEVTYLGYVHGTMAALKRMKQRDRGMIIQVGSALAHRSIPLQSAYCGAKHAIIGFTDSLRSELMHDVSHVHLTVVNLPAMNTPQFEWSRTRLPRRPRPVPPIFQPEVAADAIVWASTRRKRVVDVGFPTVMAIMAQKFAPGLADYYLARTGYDSQQTWEPVARNRPDNLFKPVSGEFGAHGTFDSRARDLSREFWLKKHFGKFVLVGLGAGVAVIMMLRGQDALTSRGRTDIAA